MPGNTRYFERDFQVGESLLAILDFRDDSTDLSVFRFRDLLQHRDGHAAGVRVQARRGFIRGAAVPVRDVGGQVYGLAGAHVEYLASAHLQAPAARFHQVNLRTRMDVPVRARAGFETYAQQVDVGRGEPRRFAGDHAPLILWGLRRAGGSDAGITHSAHSNMGRAPPRQFYPEVRTCR